MNSTYIFIRLFETDDPKHNEFFVDVEFSETYTPEQRTGIAAQSQEISSDQQNKLKQPSGYSKLAIAALVVLLALIGYTIERLYVTSEEAVSYSIDQILTSTTSEQLDRMNRFFHDQFFENDPPAILRDVLRQSTSDDSDSFDRDQLRDGLREFFDHTNVKRNVVMDEDIKIDGEKATVNLSVLTFFQNDSSADRIERKFLSKWTLKFIRSEERWQVTHITYRQ